MRSLILTALVACSAMAFGVPDVPDVPEGDLPDIEIPGMELLDEVQVKLDGIVEETDALRGLIPDLAVLDELSVKLAEMRDTDPEAEALQAEVDALRAELVAAREEIQAITDELDAEIGAVKTTVDNFTAGLPI